MFELLHQHVIEGNEDGVIEAVEAALADGIDPGIILNDGLILPMKEVGDRFESGTFFVPEMLIAAQAMADEKLWRREARTHLLCHRHQVGHVERITAVGEVTA